jgi:hypothetical protein
MLKCEFEPLRSVNASFSYREFRIGLIMSEALRASVDPQRRTRLDPDVVGEAEPSSGANRRRGLPSVGREKLAEEGIVSRLDRPEPEG